MANRRSTHVRLETSVVIEPRMTISTQRGAGGAAGRPGAGLYGLEIGDLADLPSGRGHPILARLQCLGWLASRWEEIDTSSEGGPAHRYYRLTAEGLHAAQAALPAPTGPRRASDEPGAGHTG